MVATRKGAGMAWRSYGRFPGSALDCPVDDVETLVPIGPSTYRLKENIDVMWKIVYTDYKHFAVAFACNNFMGSKNCTNPEVTVFSRTMKLRQVDQAYVDREIRRLCVDPDVKHNDFFQNPCPPDKMGSRRIRGHCYRIWSDICRQWRSLLRHCYWTPLRCSYYTKQLSSCYYECDSCDMGLYV